MGWENIFIKKIWGILVCQLLKMLLHGQKDKSDSISQYKNQTYFKVPFMVGKKPWYVEMLFNNDLNFELDWKMNGIILKKISSTKPKNFWLSELNDF